MAADFRMLDNLPLMVYALGVEHEVLYVNKMLRDFLSPAYGGPVGGKCCDALHIFDWCPNRSKCPLYDSFSRSGQLRNLPVGARFRFSGSGFSKYLLSTSLSAQAGEPFLLVRLNGPSAVEETVRVDEARIRHDNEAMARRVDELTAIKRITLKIARAQDLQEVLKLTLEGGNKGPRREQRGYLSERWR